MSPWPFVSLLPATALAYLALAYDCGRALTFVLGGLVTLVFVRAGVEWGARP